MSNRVLILYTGGTIGMVETQRGYAPQPGYLRRVLDNITELFNETMPQWELKEFDRLYDSSDISAPQWNHIAGEISREYENYDGFVILHGTDTMAYTASALSFMLEGLQKPVVLTGSQIPIGKPRSDARENLIGALLIAGEGRCREVCLFFGGKLMRGNRATKVSADGLAAFDSPNFPLLAQAGIDIKYNSALFHQAEGPFHLTEMDDQLPIAVLKIFPGIQFRLFEGIMTERLRGLVLEAFGVGNIPQYDAGLLPVIKKAGDNGTVITVCTQCLQGSVQLGAYETSCALRSAGALSGYDMTVEATVTKLTYLLSKYADVALVKSQMEQNLAGELSR